MLKIKFNTAYQVVDVAILRNTYDGLKILLCKKKGKQLWQFVGGFSDPDSFSLEDDARREVKEETDVDITYPKYIGSCKIDDERFVGLKDAMKSAFFVAYYINGNAVARDDIDDVRWVKVDSIKPTDIVPKHRILWFMLKLHLTQRELSDKMNQKEKQDDDARSDSRTG